MAEVDAADVGRRPQEVERRIVDVAIHAVAMKRVGRRRPPVALAARDE
jgi:hypothetical protein